MTKTTSAQVGMRTLGNVMAAGVDNAVMTVRRTTCRAQRMCARTEVIVIWNGSAQRHDTLSERLFLVCV
ncbi:unnamed protein product [Toxocara canis]|uniref:Secreted protein n=1 Tax=Toxocara canis TaxID=6265 RepID=A0A183TXU1_TOXCA|nr:unnamed protein product [Toxocara canis]